MAYNDKITTSKHGRRLGLNQVSSSESGGSNGPAEFLVGPEDFRIGVTTEASTASNLPAYGLDNILGGSVYTLDPPIPGVRKVLTNDGGAYVKVGNSGEGFWSTAGSSATTLKLSTAGPGTVELLGFTTAYWVITGGNSLVAASTST